MCIASKESCTNHAQKITFFYILFLVQPLFILYLLFSVTILLLLLFYPRAILPLLSDITLKDGNKQPPSLGSIRITCTDASASLCQAFQSSCLGWGWKENVKTTVELRDPR